MLVIIYPYRERDLKRIRLSLQSLNKQTIKDFEVRFVDYGSPINHAEEVEELINEFAFANYQYCYTEHQPWNKSKALNSVVKTLNSGYFFVADVDMIFHEKFIETALKLAETGKVWYFKVGFLDEKESKESKNFEAYNIKFASEEGATGLTLCSVEAAKQVNGFDEFYHFWGSEDTDFHVRLTNAGSSINFYDTEILMLHQWHIIYRNKETSQLTTHLQIAGIVQFNHKYLKAAKSNKTIKANKEQWGKIQNETDYKDLETKTTEQVLTLDLSKTAVNFFLFQTLPKSIGLHHFIFKSLKNKETLRLKAKSLLNKNETKKYTLKEVNDLVLFNIVNFYHQFPYRYEVSKDLNEIYFSIKK